MTKKESTNTVTLEQVSEFKKHAQKYQFDETNRTKFAWAISAMLRKIDKADYFKKMLDNSSEVDEELNSIRTNYQSVDQDGNLLYADEKMRLRKFTPENEKQCSKEIGKVLKKLEADNQEFLKEYIEIEPYYADEKSIPGKLTYDEIQAFAGFVLPVDYMPKI